MSEVTKKTSYFVNESNTLIANGKSYDFPEIVKSIGFIYRCVEVILEGNSLAVKIACEISALNNCALLLTLDLDEVFNEDSPEELNNGEKIIEKIREEFMSQLLKQTDDFLIPCDPKNLRDYISNSVTEHVNQVIVHSVEGLKSSNLEFLEKMAAEYDKLSQTLTSSFKSLETSCINTMTTINESLTALLLTIKEYIVELKINANLYLSNAQSLSEVMKETSELISNLTSATTQFSGMTDKIMIQVSNCNDSVMKLQASIVNILQSIKFNAEAIDATLLLKNITGVLKDSKDVLSIESRREL